MFFRKKNNTDSKPSDAKDAAGPKSSATPAVKVSAADSSTAVKPVRRSFPGPRDAKVALRVSMERKAYGELIAHAKESLEVEVCGVLAGQVCEDENGLFVQVDAAIRGTAASQASTHVTFTQETWNSIHKTLDRDYPKLRIVGWYHTHPGFGVEFSDMDLFIQNNFFSGPTQVALVTDPLGGATAICVNTAKGVQYLDRFWVDGREQSCRVPAGKATPSPGESSGATAAEAAKDFQALEARVSQLTQAVDDLRVSLGRFLTFVGFVFCLAIFACAGYFIYNMFLARNEPPKLMQYAEIPVPVAENKAVRLGVQVIGWPLPSEQNEAYFSQLKKLLQEVQQAQTALAAGGTNAAALTNSTSPVPNPSHERK